MSEEAKTWERQRDSDGKLEPNRWYSRFTAYRLMDSGRSLLGCVNQEREQKGTKRQNTVPGAWSRAFEQWRWRERAEAWDEAEREREQQEYETERLEWRKRRRRLLQGFFGKLAQALDQFDPGRATLSQLTQAVKTVMDELRAEFDDLPTEKHDVTTGGKPLFDIEEWKQRASRQRQAVEQMEEPGCGTPDA